jgi:hypothetical protein
MAVSIADQFEILPTIPRRTGRQINRAGHPADNPIQFWQQSMYFPFMNNYVNNNIFSASKQFFFCRNDVQAIDFLRKGSYAPDIIKDHPTNVLCILHVGKNVRCANMYLKVVLL